MYLAAGEAIGAAHRTSYEAVITSRVFGPLGMRSSNLSIGAMQAAGDFSYGYRGEGEREKVPMRQLAFLDGIAPAGAINSTAEDMGQWLRLMLAGGVHDGKRIVSDSGFQALLSPAVKVGAGSYGLGLFIEDWHGHRLYSHPGGITGFGSRSAFLPDQRLGWVVLTNFDDQRLPKSVGELVYDHLVGPR